MAGAVPNVQRVEYICGGKGEYSGSRCIQRQQCGKEKESDCDFIQCINDRCPSADAFGGQDAADPRERVHDHADRHQEILLDGLQHQLLNDGFHFGTEILAIAKAKIVQTEGKSKFTCILPKRRLSKT